MKRDHRTVNENDYRDRRDTSTNGTIKTLLNKYRERIQRHENERRRKLKEQDKALREAVRRVEEDQQEK